MISIKLEKLKRVVIKEELFVLTGDFKEAIILNQFIYWGERVKDYKKFVDEENQRKDMNIYDLQCGWIYKSVKELKQEIMINLSEASLLKYISELLSKDYLIRRTNPNPKYKFDRTYQYRLNLIKIQRDLNKLGYTLEGYSDIRFSILENAELEKENLSFRI